MKEKPLFCTVCGKERKWVDADFYDENTGKKKRICLPCEIKDCNHGHHLWGKKTSIFKGSRTFCTICGQEKYSLYSPWGLD